MFSYGTFSGIFHSGLKDTIKKIKEFGFNCVQLDLDFPDLDLSYDETLVEKLTVDKCHIIRDAFREASLPIVAISGYANLMTPDPRIRNMNHTRLKALLRLARELGTPYVISESGGLSGYNDDNWIWDWEQENETPKVFNAAVEMIKKFAIYAYDYGSVFLLENYRNGIIGTVDHVNEVFSRVDHPGLGLVMDPCNYFNEENINDMDNEINRIFNTLSHKIKIAHAKDLKKFNDISEAPIGSKGGRMLDLPNAGMGIFNYELYLKRLYELHPNIPLILEHFTDLSQIPETWAYVDRILKTVSA